MAKSSPEVHNKTWGRELWIANSPLYCGKILEVNQGYCCSLHSHRKKDETFYVLEGHILLERAADVFDAGIHASVVLGPGAVVHIPVGILHRFSGITDAKLVEISTQHFEDDSHRVEPSDRWDPTPYLDQLEVTDA